MTTQDLSEPISVLLRKGTAKVHQDAERSAGAARLLKGELDKLEYVRFLMILYRVYSVMEDGLERWKDNSVLAHIYRPSVLARTQPLAEDIAYLTGLPLSSWQGHPLWLELINSPPGPLSTFINRLYSLSLSQETAYLLLAHAYTRYLGDLSGGQIIKRLLSKAYDLPPTGEGVEFYTFYDGQGEGRELTAGEMKELKEWFREGMNEGVGDDEGKKEALVEEAILSFKLNSGIFAIIRDAPAAGNTPISSSLPTAAKTHLAFPTSKLSWKSKLHSLGAEKVKNYYPAGSAAFVLVVAAFGAIQYLSSGTSTISVH